jgi:hypothetical protein
MVFPTKFSVNLVDAGRLETFVEDGIPLSTSSRNAEASLSQLRKIGTGHEAGSIGLDGCQYREG